MTAPQTTDPAMATCPPAPYPAAKAAREVLQTQAPQVLPKSSRDAAVAGCCHPPPARHGIP